MVRCYKDGHGPCLVQTTVCNSSNLEHLSPALFFDCRRVGVSPPSDGASGQRVGLAHRNRHTHPAVMRLQVLDLGQNDEGDGRQVRQDLELASLRFQSGPARDGLWLL
jgi:hypothetical protein